MTEIHGGDFSVEIELLAVMGFIAPESFSAPVLGFGDDLFVVGKQPVVLTHDPAAL